MSDPTVLLTTGLVLFAGVQVIVMLRTESRAKVERAKDEAAERRRLEREDDIAYQTCYAEHFRLWSLGKRYRGSDLIELSLAGLLRPEDLLPRDWGLITQMLGRLSAEAGYLGATAMSLAHDGAASVATFNATIKKLADTSGSVDLTSRLKYVRDTPGSGLGSELAKYEEKIRKSVEETALLLWDAICHSASGKRVRTLDFKDDLASEIGKKLVAELVERGKQLPEPKGNENAAG